MKLTREQIEQTTVGPELDALVAMRIMDYRWYVTEIDPTWTRLMTKAQAARLDGPRWGEGWQHKWVPVAGPCRFSQDYPGVAAFSRDTAAALQIVPRLTAEGWRFYLEIEPGSDPCAIFINDAMDVWCCESASTVSEAISRAALMTRVEKENNGDGND